MSRKILAGIAASGAIAGALAIGAASPAHAQCVDAGNTNAQNSECVNLLLQQGQQNSDFAASQRAGFDATGARIAELSEPITNGVDQFGMNEVTPIQPFAPSPFFLF